MPTSSERTAALSTAIRTFLDERIYPAEKVYAAQLNNPLWKEILGDPGQYPELTCVARWEEYYGQPPTQLIYADLRTKP